VKRISGIAGFSGWLTLAVCVVLVLLSWMPQAVTGHSPFAPDMAGLQAPTMHHWCGTDMLGRDVLSRTLAASRVSILIGLGSRLLAVGAGLFFGIAVCFSRGMLRLLLDRTIEVFLAIPALLLAMALAMALGEGYLTISLAIAAGTWAPVARLLTVKIHELLTEDYVLAAQALGAGRRRIFLRHVLPGLLPVLWPVLMTGIGSSIMMEATLSFIGLAGSAGGSSLPSWGGLVQQGAKFIIDAPWLILPPSVLLVVIVLLFNSVGDEQADLAVVSSVPSRRAR